MVTYWATHCACWLVELHDLANKFNSLRQTALWEEAFTSRLTDTCSGSNFFRLKVAHEHLATPSSEVNSPFWDCELGLQCEKLKTGTIFFLLNHIHHQRANVTARCEDERYSYSYEDAIELYILPRCHKYEPAKVRRTSFSCGDVVDGYNFLQQKENNSYMKKCQRLWNFLSNHVMIAWTWRHWWIFQMYLFGVSGQIRQLGLSSFYIQ